MKLRSIKQNLSIQLGTSTPRLTGQDFNWQNFNVGRLHLAPEDLDPLALHVLGRQQPTPALPDTLYGTRCKYTSLIIEIKQSSRNSKNTCAHVDFPKLAQLGANYACKAGLKKTMSMVHFPTWLTWSCSSFQLMLSGTLPSHTCLSAVYQPVGWAMAGLQGIVDLQLLAFALALSLAKKTVVMTYTGCGWTIQCVLDAM